LQALHQERFAHALKQTVRFFLFDIDHNLTDHTGAVPEYAIKRLANTMVDHGIGVGFVSGRPEVSSLEGGPDIQQVVQSLLAQLPECLHRNIVVFPEYAGYGKHMSSGEVYDYGFLKLFEQHQEEILALSQRVPAHLYDHLEVKKTGLSVWLKPESRCLSTMGPLVSEFSDRLEAQPLGEHFKVVNGANRTLDFLPQKVNKKNAIEQTARIFSIDSSEIASSDDQGQWQDAGFDFTNHALGFATVHHSSKDCSQMATHLCFGKTGLNANMRLLELLKFHPLAK